MSTPFTRDNSSVPYFRKAVPKDLQAVVGKAVIKQSLRTKDPVQAALRHAELEETWERNFASLRAGVVTLTHRERVALAGVLYREYLDAYWDEPGEAWEVASRILNDGVAAGSPEVKILVGGSPEIASRLLARLKDRHRKTLTDFLAREGLSLSGEEFGNVLGHVNRVMYDGSKRILSFHHGNYAEHATDASHPEWKKPVPKDDDGKPIIPDEFDLLKIYDTYARQQEHAPKTVAKFRPILEQVAAEHPDIRTITRAWCIAWKDQLLEKGLSPKTVKAAYLSVLNTVCAEAYGNERIPTNPAARLRLKVRDPIRNRTVQGYRDDEAAIVLTATTQPMSERLSEDQKRARRWLPWLCCYTGARIGELAQLRGQDVVEEAGYWFIEVTPDAGPVKNRKPRRVPIHPHLLEQGFLALASEFGDGPLFAEPSRRRSLEATLCKKTAENIGRWVRSLGLTDPELQPSHGWRHRFSTLRRGTSIPPEMASYMMGHAPVKEGEKYGGWRPEVLGSAIKHFPYIEQASGRPMRSLGSAGQPYFEQLDPQIP